MPASHQCAKTLGDAGGCDPTHGQQKLHHCSACPSSSLCRAGVRKSSGKGRRTQRAALLVLSADTHAVTGESVIGTKKMRVLLGDTSGFLGVCGASMLLSKLASGAEWRWATGDALVLRCQGWLSAPPARLRSKALNPSRVGMAHSPMPEEELSRGSTQVLIRLIRDGQKQAMAS